MLAALLLPFAVRALWRRGDPAWERRIGRALAVVPWAALVVGLALAVRRASVVDDAFISFRYARNLAEGHGLVFNLSERVEGYTNFLWTLVLSVLSLTGIDLLWIALVLGLVAFVGAVLVTLRLGRVLAEAHGVHPYVPLAPVLLSVQLVFVSFATTGLETMAASFFVALGALALVRAETPRGAARAGAWLIVAVLLHPDHAIFYAAGAAVLCAEERPWSRRRWPVLLAYALPSAAYAATLVWKLGYYGQVLPNTYYAKSGGSSYYSQGAVYAATFYLSSHLWLALPIAAAWVVSRAPAGPVHRFKAFFVVSFLAFNFWVLRLGGDFMLGRFYVSLIPLLLLAAEQWLNAARAREGGARPALGPWLVAGLLLATAHGGSLVRPRQTEFRIADESTYYPVGWSYPLEVRHFNGEVGHVLHDALTARGIELTLATTGIGMVSFYSRLPVVDILGLTDATVARMPTQRRRRPGHEKVATVEYLRSRNVDLVREPELYVYLPARAQRVAAVRGLPGRRWLLLRYERNRMRRLLREVPELQITDFERYLDRYIASLRRRDPAQVRQDLAWFRPYYFDVNEDPARLAPIERRALGRARAAKRR